MYNLYNMAKWIACMAHIKHAERDYIKKYIENRYTDYIIAYENSAKVGEHIHFMLWSEDPKDYSRLVQNVFKNKYRLRGRATKGLCRQYGKVKEIEKLEKMMSYTVKDKNVDYKVGDNLTKEDVATAISNSYKREDNLGKLNKIMQEYIDAEKEDNTLVPWDGTKQLGFNKKIDPHPTNFTLNRSRFVTKYTETYFEIFEKVPTRNMIINAVVKYDKRGGIKWYLDTVKVLTEWNSYDMKL